MAFNEKDLATVEMLGLLLSKTGSTPTAADDRYSFKSAAVSGNTVNFYRTTTATGTPAFSFDLPEEILLDQINTTLEESFTWSSTTYPNSTDPNLDGKIVLVLAVKDEFSNIKCKY